MNILEKKTIGAFALALGLLSISGSAQAEQKTLTKGQLPEFAKSEAQGKLSKIVMFTSKSGKYKVVAFTRERGKKKKLQTRIVAYELLKGAKMASVIRSTDFKKGSDYKFQEVQNWTYKGNPVLIMTKNLGNEKLACEVFIFDGPEMKQVNSIKTTKVSVDKKGKKGELVLVAKGSGRNQVYKWNGEKLVEM